MADRYLLESGAPDGYLLEDGSGVLLADEVASVVDWTPAGLSSLKGWYKADTLTGAEGDAKTMPDATANGNNTTSGTNSPLLRTGNLTGTPLAVLEFDQAFSRSLTLPSGMVSTFTQGSVFFVAKRRVDPPTIGNAIGCIVGGTGTSGSADHYPYTDSNVYDGLLSTVRKTVGDPGDLSQWHVGSMRSKASDYRYAINGLDFFTTATNTVGAASGSPTIGINSAGNYFDGWIAEVLIFNDFLTESDRQKVEGYLAWKWGQVASLDGIGVLAGFTVLAVLRNWESSNQFD